LLKANFIFVGLQKCYFSPLGDIQMSHVQWYYQHNTKRTRGLCTKI